jgi:hypothetical protein
MMKYTIRETTKNSVYGMANMFGKYLKAVKLAQATSKVGK